LSPSELFSNAFIVLAAGFETTATALGYCTYRLAAHPDIQEKLNEEILEHWSPDIDYYDLVMSKLTYLDLFVREVLRMHPIAIQVVNRECMEDTHIGKYHIQKGIYTLSDIEFEEISLISCRFVDSSGCSLDSFRSTIVGTRAGR